MSGIYLHIPFCKSKCSYCNFCSIALLKQKTDFLKALENELQNKLQNTFSFYRQTVNEYQKAEKLYNTDFEGTLMGMNDNFKKRNVSIIEFIDFFESYNDALTELSRIKTQLVNCAEELNILTGKDIY